MSRPRLRPRLYLRPARADRGAVWVIRDGSREIGTGCGPDRRADAEHALTAYLAAKYAPAPSGPRLDDILIADVVRAYLAEHAAHTPSADWIAATAMPVIDWWGAMTLAAVRGATCRDYVAWRTRQTVRNATRRVSEATARHELKTLRAAIHHWHREHGPLPSLPAVTLPKRAPARTRWLTRDEAAAMIRAARRIRQCRHVARVVLIGIYTGTRPGAILALGWQPTATGGHIDVAAGVIHRRAAGAAETRKRQPPARIPERLLPHLRRWRAADMAQRPPMPHVIHYGGGPVGKLRRSWATVRAAAGLGAEVTPHVLRHTAATWLMQWGVDMAATAGMLGMSVQMIETVYGHHHPDFQAEAAGAARRRRTGDNGRAPETPRKPPSTSGISRQQASTNIIKLKGKRA